jgi:hypothetical protein
MLGSKYTMGIFAIPLMTRTRIGFAVTVAVLTDFVQLSLGPFGWFWVDQVLDVLAMILTCATLGFHLLLLPTFVLEFLPTVDMLPTWTACTAVVIMLRKRAQTPAPRVPESPPPGSSPSIDIPVQVTRVPPKL